MKYLNAYVMEFGTLESGVSLDELEKSSGVLNEIE